MTRLVLRILRIEIRQLGVVRLKKLSESAFLLRSIGVLSYEVCDVLACGAVCVEQQCWVRSGTR